MSNFQACSLFGSILSGRPGCVCGGTLFGGTHAASSAFGSKSSAGRLSSGSGVVTVLEVLGVVVG